jgi:hypothetical protein
MDALLTGIVKDTIDGLLKGKIGIKSFRWKPNIGIRGYGT